MGVTYEDWDERRREWWPDAEHREYTSYSTSCLVASWDVNYIKVFPV